VCRILDELERLGLVLRLDVGQGIARHVPHRRSAASRTA
jgi:hypothetical protein